MQTLQDKAKLARLLRQEGIAAHFGAPGLAFQLRRYQKGELVVRPDRPLDALLFVVRGSAHIYGRNAEGAPFFVGVVQRHDMLGDVEFCGETAASPFYAEAQSELLCVALPIAPNRAALEQDPVFLRWVLQVVYGKLLLFSRLDLTGATLEERLLIFLRKLQPDHCLHGVNQGMAQLHCSRRQLQRVLRALCQRGWLQKEGRGQYRLTAAGMEEP